MLVDRREALSISNSLSDYTRGRLIRVFQVQYNGLERLSFNKDEWHYNHEGSPLHARFSVPALHKHILSSFALNSVWYANTLIQSIIQESLDTNLTITNVDFRGLGTHESASTMDPNNFMLDPQLAEQGLNMDNMTFDELCSMTDDMVGNTNTDTTTNDFGMDMPADNTFQTAPMMGPEPDVPADNYDPMENLWYNTAPPMAPGAAYSKTLGWHYKVRYGHTGPSMSLPQSAVGLSPASGYSTPMAAQGQIPYPYAQAPQERIPVAYPMQVPQLQTPQPRQRPARREAPTSGPAPKRKKTESRQTSIYRACVCSQPGKKAKVKRPRNMFILYRGAHAERIAKELGLRGKQQDISRIVSERWRNETPEIRAEFAELARIEAENHAAANPGYVYRPGTNDSAKFGDESCTCGAYAANVEYNKTENRVKRAKERIEKDAAAEEEDLPEYDPFASQAGSKRKRASNNSASHGSKRPMRSTRSSNSYREVEEDDIFSPGEW